MHPAWEEADSYPTLARLENQESICFELLEPAQKGGAVEAVYLLGTDGAKDMTSIMGQPGISIWPFLERQGGGTLRIGLSGTEQRMRLWFEVDDKRPWIGTHLRRARRRRGHCNGAAVARKTRLRWKMKLWLKP